MTLNLGANTGRHTVNIATGQATSTITIGSSSSTIVLNNFWTTLPTSPVDGQEIVYAASSTAVYWQLKYNASAAKWMKIGGPPLYHDIDTNEATATTTWTGLATNGPLLTVPLAGNYDISWGFNGYVSAVPNEIDMGLGIAGANPVSVVSAAASINGHQINSYVANASRRKVFTLSANNEIRAKYQTSGGTASFQERWLRIDPIFVQ